MTTETTYLLGHDEQELARLEQQATILRPATTTILRLAGIEPGMRVLDLGTGAGDVAFEVADLVGPKGSVVGIDQSVKALRFAAIRAERRGLENVTFIHDDILTVRITERFDAVVGRLILLYTQQPAEILRRFGGLVRPGGVMAAMEYEMTAAGTVPPTAVSSRAIGWIVEAFNRSGLDASLGARLGPIMRDAGLEPTVLGLQLYRDPGDRDGPTLAAETVRTLLPAIQKTGIATAGEVDIDTLTDRLARDAVHATFKPPVLVGAWARVES